MKIQCDACEKAPAVLICCADEAALCEKCDVEIHAANKLASKHQRLLLECLSNKLPRCDICQEKSAFIFCVEDRALFCRSCDEAIHVTGSLSGNHQRYLATGIRVALGSMCNKDTEKGHHEPPNQNFALMNSKIPTTKESSPSFLPSAWAVDEFLQLSDYESSDKKETAIGFGELDWFGDIGLFPEQIPNESLTAAEVPELPNPQTSSPAFWPLMLLFIFILYKHFSPGMLKLRQNIAIARAAVNRRRHRAESPPPSFPSSGAPAYGG